MFRVSLLRAYEVIIYIVLSFSYYSNQEPASDMKYRGIAHAINRFIDAVNYSFSYYPLPIRDLARLMRSRKAT